MSIGLFLDIAVAVVVLISVIIAVLRGFIREILTIFALVGAFASAYVFGPMLFGTTDGWLGVQDTPEESQVLFDIVPYSALSYGLSYAIVGIGAFIVLSIFSHIISKSVHSIGLGALDRALGAVFGLARAVLVLGLLYLLPYHIIEDEQKEEYFNDSQTHVYLEATSRFIDGYMPKVAKDQVEEGSEVVKAISETRQKMEEMEILSGDQDAQEQSLPSNGYTDEFRDGFDQIIEDVQGAVENIEVEQPSEDNLNE